MIRTILFWGWFIPGLTILGLWAGIDLYRKVWGSEKNISWVNKNILPNFMSVVFSFIPLFNIALLIGTIRLLLIKEERKKYL